MDTLDEEILGFWRLLHENEVEYILVGGFAANLHGFQRTTGDLDLWIKDSQPNRRKFREVLRKANIGDFEGIETTQLVPGWSTLKFVSGFELDIMTSMAGFPAESFDKCHALSPTAIIENIPVKFLHINQLIEAKKAAGRPKDILDVIELERIRDSK
ncbi:MAG: DUF6036 family nucleotidyltransferase [Bacteroidota bacterium]